MRDEEEEEEEDDAVEEGDEEEKHQKTGLGNRQQDFGGVAGLGERGAGKKTAMFNGGNSKTDRRKMGSESCGAVIAERTNGGVDRSVECKGTSMP